MKLIKDERISFILLNKVFYDSFLPLNRNDKQAVLNVIDVLSEKLLNTDTGICQFQENYERYEEPFSYKEKAELEYKSAKHTLDETKTKILGANGSIDLSLLNWYFLFSSCSKLHSDSWFMRPEIYFSQEFLDTLSDESKELLFRHHDYEQEPKNLFYLPKLTKLDFGGVGYIYPHYIDSEKAMFLLKNLYKLSSNKFEGERRAFEELLNDVRTEGCILVVNYKDY